MPREYKDKEKISVDLSGKLLENFDKACQNEYGEDNKRAFQIRSLMREYIEKSKV